MKSNAILAGFLSLALFAFAGAVQAGGKACSSEDQEPCPGEPEESSSISRNEGRPIPIDGLSFDEFTEFVWGGLGLVDKGIGALDRDIEKLKGGVALSLAVANIPPPLPGRNFSIGVGLATVGYGEPGVALGIMASPPKLDALSLKASVAHANPGRYGGGVGIGAGSRLGNHGQPPEVRRPFAKGLRGPRKSERGGHERERNGKFPTHRQKSPLGWARERGSMKYARP